MTEDEKGAKTVPRQPMPEQVPHERAHNFREVALGYSEDLACQEASRCLQCKKPKCIQACPVEVDIPNFIAKIRDKDFLGAARMVKEKNSLPAFAVRFCPQESQC